MSRLFLSLGVLAVLGTPAYAGPSFTDDFGDGVLNPLLEDVSGAYTESGGVISNTNNYEKAWIIIVYLPSNCQGTGETQA